MLLFGVMCLLLLNNVLTHSSYRQRRQIDFGGDSGTGVLANFAFFEISYLQVWFKTLILTV
jgi:hypothetical protein